MSILFKKNGVYYVDKIKLGLADDLLLESGETLSVEIRVIDKRIMSDQQRKFIFKLCSIIQDYTGLNAELFRVQAMVQNIRINGIPKSSLTQYSMKDANFLIEIIIDYFLENGITLPKKLLDENEFYFTKQHTYIMSLKRQCVLCGRHADLHHVDTVGMGFDRRKIDHTGKRMLPLCREHHVEAHAVGDQVFINKYHLEPVEVDRKLNHFILTGILKNWDK